VAHAHPFIHKEYAAATDTIINTYGTTDDTAKCLMEGITGQRQLNNRLVAHD
jgi:beta-N-acetylhexosaminidase